MGGDEEHLGVQMIAATAIDQTRNSTIPNVAKLTKI